MLSWVSGLDRFISVCMLVMFFLCSMLINVVVLLRNCGWVSVGVSLGGVGVL